MWSKECRYEWKAFDLSNKNLTVYLFITAFAEEASTTQMSDYYGDYLSEETHMWHGW